MRGESLDERGRRKSNGTEGRSIGDRKPDGFSV